MKKFCSFLLLFVFTGALVNAQDKTESSKKPPVKKSDDTDLEKELRANPDDLEKFNKYMIKGLTEINGIMSEKPDKAEKLLNEMDLFLKSLEPKEERSKQLLGRANQVVGSYRTRLEIARISFDELKKRLEADPDDNKTLSMLVSKTMNEASGLARAKPLEAEKIVNNSKAILKAAKEKSEKEATQKSIENLLSRAFLRLESTIEGGKRILALIGKDAAELKIKDWANGKALSDKDLEGKVVLLDFWAVWCGPCIATFPHLKEWHDEYADKGLVIIGLTRFYNYEWDSDAGRAKRSTEKVKPEDELKMLGHFAESHALKHRLAVQSDDSNLSDYYAVSGIPHVVIIDQKGKIRMIRVGSGPKNAHDIEELLKELMPSKP